MIDYNVMEFQVRKGKARLIKTGQRRSTLSGKFIKHIELNGKEYKNCSKCNFYKTFDNFTKITGTKYYQTKCKSCRASESTKKYKKDLAYHLRPRLQSVNKKVKKEEDKCTPEEFHEFFHNERCPYTGRTLLDDWKNPNPNPNLSLEIDHIVPVSEGGSSKPSNLQVMPRAINALKRDCTPQQFRETLDFLANFSNIPEESTS